jgi:plastocyanin
MRRMIMTIAVAVLASAGCKDDRITTPGANQILMQSNQFVPFTKTLAAGTVLELVNTDNITHTFTSYQVPTGASAFDINLPGNTTAQITLTVPGDYFYRCLIHGSPNTGMRGSVTVN